MRKSIRVMDRHNQTVLDLQAGKAELNQTIVQVRKYPNGQERGRVKNGLKVIRQSSFHGWTIVINKDNYLARVS